MMKYDDMEYMFYKLYCGKGFWSVATLGTIDALGPCDLTENTQNVTVESNSSNNYVYFIKNTVIITS